MSKIKLLFDKIRFGHVWENQNTFSKNRLTFSVNKKLKEDYIKFWKDKLSLDGSEDAKLDAVLFTPKIYFANFTCTSTG
jgi:hypothetical protein